MWEQPERCLPGTYRLFTAAKIADCFRDLDRDRKLTIPTAPGEVHDKDFELVGCFQTAAGTVVHQWVV